MTQLDESLSKLKKSVDEVLHFNTDQEQLYRYITRVVAANVEDVLRTLRTQIEKPHALSEVEVGQPNVAIHYTTISALVSMLENGTSATGQSSLRLYDSNNFNDPDEGNFFNRNLGPKSPAVDALLDIEYSPHAYIASFIIPRRKAGYNDTDAQRDMSNNLVFWRTYGDEGMGCSLTLFVPRSKLRKVLYGRDAVRQTSQLLLPALDSLYACLKPIFDLPSMSYISEHLQGTISGHIDRVRYLYKSDAYEYERECRIVIPEVDADKDLIRFQYEDGQGRGVRLKHYYEVEALDVRNIFVTGSIITFGPRVTGADNLRYYFQSLLRKMDRSYGPMFKTSKIPYQVSD